MRSGSTTPAAPPLLITVSFNASSYEASPYFTSRVRWAKDNGFDHLYVTESTTDLKLDAHCSAWLRLPLMQALRGRSMFYLDNDCIIAPDCPAPELVTGELDELFIARGHSGRPNSGVLILSPAGSDVFDFCIDRVGQTPPAECAAPYENGHVIWACTVLPWRPLPAWMNDAKSQDGYVVHHTGPNRCLRALSYHNDFAGQYDFFESTADNPAAMRSMASGVLHRLGFEGQS